MNKEKEARLRTLLEAMEDIMRNDIDDEEMFEEWLIGGIPDGYDFKEEPAYETDEIVLDYLDCFARIIRINKDWGGRLYNK